MRKAEYIALHTYRKCASDQAGSAFGVWVSWYHTTRGDHGYRSFTTNLAHLRIVKFDIY